MRPCTAAGPGRPRGHSRPVSVGRVNSLNLATGCFFQKEGEACTQHGERGGGLQTRRNSVVLCTDLGMFLRVSRRITLKEVQELEKGNWGAGRGSAGGRRPPVPGWGRGFSPEKPEPRSARGRGLLAGPGALAVVQAASCREGAGSPGPSAFAPWSLPLPLQTCWAPPTCQGSCQHLPREGAWLKAPFRDPPTRPWCLTPEYRDLPGGAQALGKPSEAWNWVHVRFLAL